MFTKRSTVDRTEFIDKHGDVIGYCSLGIYEKEDADGFYAVIDNDLPGYSECTAWGNIDDARRSHEQDIEYYTAKYADI